MKKVVFLLVIMSSFCSGKMFAQGCVTCTQTAAGLGESSARGLNTGILYLAALPLLFIFTVAYIWYRKNKVSSKEQ